MGDSRQVNVPADLASSHVSQSCCFACVHLVLSCYRVLKPHQTGTRRSTQTYRSRCEAQIVAEVGLILIWDGQCRSRSLMISSVYPAATVSASISHRILIPRPKLGSRQIVVNHFIVHFLRQSRLSLRQRLVGASISTAALYLQGGLFVLAVPRQSYRKPFQTA